MKHLVKRAGHTEAYDEKKLKRSIYRAALNAHHSDAQAKKIAAAAMKKLSAWIKTRKSVRAHVLHVKAVAILKTIDPDVALLYEHHENLS